MVGGEGDSGAPGVRAQGDDKLTDFDGITVQVQNIIADPTTDGGLRLIAKITDHTDEARRIAFIQPPATLVDEYGNIYVAVASTGINICGRVQLWDVDVDNCAYYQKAKDDPVRMKTDLPVNAVITFLPSPNAYAKELADLAETGNLQARVAYYADDLTNGAYTDVVINGLALPD